MNTNNIDSWETNQNAVIMHYPSLIPVQGERPIGCTIQYRGWAISHTSLFPGFHIHRNLNIGDENHSFTTLKAARLFIDKKASTEDLNSTPRCPRLLRDKSESVPSFTCRSTSVCYRKVCFEDMYLRVEHVPGYIKTIEKHEDS